MEINHAEADERSGSERQVDVADATVENRNTFSSL